METCTVCNNPATCIYKLGLCRAHCGCEQVCEPKDALVSSTSWPAVAKVQSTIWAPSPEGRVNAILKPPHPALARLPHILSSAKAKIDDTLAQFVLARAGVIPRRSHNTED